MAQTAVSIGANVFQFFTRNPRGGAAKPLDKTDIAAFSDYAAQHGVGPILAHAPYTLNAAGAEARVREFAEATMADDLVRIAATPGALYNFHPGSHVGQGTEAGIELIASMLARIFFKRGARDCAPYQSGARDCAPYQSGAMDSAPYQNCVLLETMAGKGSEIGRSFEEIKTIIDLTDSKLGHAAPLGVCLDTCHVWDAGYDIVGDLDGVIAQFDAVIGLGRLKAIHLNDSLNGCASHKDRHAKIGKGKIGLEALTRVINHPKLRDLPFYLETPCDLQGYKEEIALLKGLWK